MKGNMDSRVCIVSTTALSCTLLLKSVNAPKSGSSPRAKKRLTSTRAPNT